MILLAFQQISLFHPLGEYATGQIARLWGVRTGGLRRMRRKLASFHPPQPHTLSRPTEVSSH